MDNQASPVKAARIKIRRIRALDSSNVQNIPKAEQKTLLCIVVYTLPKGADHMLQQKAALPISQPVPNAIIRASFACVSR